jgi:hypothetical protein
MRRMLVVSVLAALSMTAAAQQPAFLQWPLPHGGEAYADIDGTRLHVYVVEQAAISRRYRDQGHPQFWGRITGTSGDSESAGWLAGHFTRIGLSEVRSQPIDLPPQWMPQSWSVTASSGETRLQLDRSATPAYGTPATAVNGIDVDAVWAGTGSDADFAGRDVRGKAVFMFSMPLPGSMNNTSTLEGGPKRAEANGAAAVFEIMALPGNARNVLYPVRVDIPVFALGMEDGYAIRDLIGKGGPRPPRVHIRLDVRQVPKQKSALVWGTLPGATDESRRISTVSGFAVRTPTPPSSGTPAVPRGRSCRRWRSARFASSASPPTQSRRRLRHPETSAASSDSYPASTRAISTCTSTRMTRRRRPFRGPGSRHRRAPTRESSTA